MIEWDDKKRNQTLQERGLDFADVALVNWDQALTVEDTRNPYTEPRFVTFAPIKGRLCVIAWCQRGSNMRVISLRKANKKEIEIYERS